MSAKRFVLGTLAGGVTMFLLGGLAYVVLLADFFEANTVTPGAMRETPVFWAIGLGELAMGALLTLALGRWAGVATAADGLRAGAIFGLLLGLGVGFVFYGATNLGNLTATITDIVVTVVRVALAGGAVGAVLGRVP